MPLLTEYVKCVGSESFGDASLYVALVGRGVGFKPVDLFFRRGRVILFSTKPGDYPRPDEILGIGLEEAKDRLGPYSRTPTHEEAESLRSAASQHHPDVGPVSVFCPEGRHRTFAVPGKEIGLIDLEHPERLPPGYGL